MRGRKVCQKGRVIWEITWQLGEYGDKKLREDYFKTKGVVKNVNDDNNSNIKTKIEGLKKYPITSETKRYWGVVQFMELEYFMYSHERKVTRYKNWLVWSIHKLCSEKWMFNCELQFTSFVVNNINFLLKTKYRSYFGLLCYIILISFKIIVIVFVLQKVIKYFIKQHENI